MTDIYTTSLLLRTRPAETEKLRVQFESWPHTEIGYSDASGKMIALLETENCRAIQNWISKAEKLPGVFSVFMIYHHLEPAHALNEVLQ